MERAGVFGNQVRVHHSRNPAGSHFISSMHFSACTGHHAAHVLDRARREHGAAALVSTIVLARSQYSLCHNDEVESHKAQQHDQRLAHMEAGCSDSMQRQSDTHLSGSLNCQYATRSGSCSPSLLIWAKRILAMICCCVRATLHTRTCACSIFLSLVPSLQDCSDACRTVACGQQQQQQQ